MDVTLPEWLIQAIQSLGVAGGPVMFFFWFLEYKQRREWQKDLLDRNERFITSTNELANALKEVTQAVTGTQETLRDLNKLTTDMASKITGVARRSRD